MWMHYSFDLWLTLIKSNPVFKAKRANYLFINFNPLNKSLLEVQTIIKEVDDMANTVNEVVGKNIDALEMYAMVLFKLGIKLKGVNKSVLENLYKIFEEMFLEFHPVPYDEDTITVLKKLQSDGKTLSILSNTGFIRGETVRKYLLNSEFRGIEFKFKLFSDEHGISKPNPQFFQEVVHLSPYKKEDIIHVGDNYIADVIGARTCGLHSVLINTSSFTINYLG